jgi:hypothetical protein
MQKNSKFSLFLFVSAMSVMVALLMYCQLDRYIWLNCVDLESKQIENYKNLPKIDNDSKVIISLTLTPESLEKNKKMLNSLLDQTTKVDQIILNIPPTEKKYKIPELYNKIATINELGKNYEDKITPTLLRETDGNVKIIFLDGEYIYGKDFIQTMVEQSDKKPNCIIKSSNSILLKPEFFTLNNIQTKNIEYKENFKY